MVVKVFDSNVVFAVMLTSVLYSFTWQLKKQVFFCFIGLLFFPLVFRKIMTSKVLTLTKSKSLSSVVPRKRTPSPEKNDEIVAEEMEPAVKKPKVELKASSFGLKRLVLHRLEAMRFFLTSRRQPVWFLLSLWFSFFFALAKNIF